MQIVSIFLDKLAKTSGLRELPRYHFGLIYFLLLQIFMAECFLLGFSSINVSVFQGLECCADSFISFHYISAETMRIMEFLIYYASPFSGRHIWAKKSKSRLLDDEKP